MMRRGFMHCVCTAIVLLLPGVSLAADPSEFLAGTYTEPGTGFQLPYRLFMPIDYDPAKEYPLILYLHGAGTKGTDNEAQVIDSKIDYLLAHIKTPEYSSFMLAPQANGEWLTYRDDPSIWTRMTLDLIPQLENELSIDQSRLYVTGGSMGGGGTWDVIGRRPETFAAAVPISGYGDPSKAYLMVDQPIWAFHAADDGIVLVERTRMMVQAVLAAGGNPLYTEPATGGHGIARSVYNEQPLYDWMFSQRLVPEPTSFIMALSGVVAVGCFLARRRLTRKHGSSSLDTA